MAEFTWEYKRGWFVHKRMPRVECLGCKRILTGYELRPYSVEYVYCERCYKSKVSRLEVVVEGLQADVQRATEDEKSHHLRAKQADFLSNWDEETMTPPHTDITLRASDGVDVYAHRAVLAGKSQVFKAMFSAQMKESQSGVVLIDDISHNVLEPFVRFFYTATVLPDVMHKHAACLFCAAEKYGVKLLKRICEDFLINTISKENAISTLELARKYDSDSVKEAVLHAAMSHMEKIPTFGDYHLYVERDPKLVVELYEGLVKRITRKRCRIWPPDGASKKIADRSNHSAQSGQAYVQQNNSSQVQPLAEDRAANEVVVNEAAAGPAHGAEMVS